MYNGGRNSLESGRTLVDGAALYTDTLINNSRYDSLSSGIIDHSEQNKYVFVYKYIYFKINNLKASKFSLFCEMNSCAM